MNGCMMNCAFSMEQAGVSPKMSLAGVCSGTGIFVAVSTSSKEPKDLNYATAWSSIMPAEVDMPMAATKIIAVSIFMVNFILSLLYQNFPTSTTK